jgi:Domain of unknown function (DUF4136)
MKDKMRNMIRANPEKSIVRLWLLTGFVCSVYSCSDRLKAYQDFDLDMDVRKYATYSWPERTDIESKSNPLMFNELTDKRIMKAVDFQLAKNGYKPTTSVPDLKIHYHIIVKDKSVKYLDDPGNDDYSPYWTFGQMDVYRYKEGTLIIDMIDVKTCRILWRGWAVAILDEDLATPSEKDIARVVNKIFGNFPKHPRKEHL